MRGERDYTQRVLATIRPMGVVGGNVLCLEDFEQLVPKAASPGATFAITTTQGEVWDGDGSGKYTLPINTGAVYDLIFPQPTPSVISAEVVFRRLSGTMRFTSLIFATVYGGYQHAPSVDIFDDGAELTLRYNDATGNLVPLKTISASPIDTNWHLLYLRFNMAMATYECIQFDTDRISLADVPYYRSIWTASPYGTLRLWSFPTPGNALTLLFDNMIIAYEDI